jgi:DNA-3-methyladenine glycosylase I
MAQETVPEIDARPRCGWGNSDELMVHYHDVEWGRQPGSDDEYFEALTLESFQSGLSWRTILQRREGFREAFVGFSIPVVADFTEQDIETLLGNERIIRHRGKIVAAIHNARAFQDIQQESGSFSAWLDKLPADPDVIHRALKPRLKFFGPTTCVSFLEAVGKVPTPHEDGCWKYQSAT